MAFSPNTVKANNKLGTYLDVSPDGQLLVIGDPDFVDTPNSLWGAVHTYAPVTTGAFPEFVNDWSASTRITTQTINELTYKYYFGYNVAAPNASTILTAVFTTSGTTIGRINYLLKSGSVWSRNSSTNNLNLIKGTSHCSFLRMKNYPSVPYAVISGGVLLRKPTTSWSGNNYSGYAGYERGFGKSIAASDDSTYLIIGCPGNNGYSSAVFLVKPNVSLAVYSTVISGSGTLKHGNSVTMMGSGARFAVGSPGENTTRIFTLTESAGNTVTTLIQTITKTTGDFGESVHMSDDGLVLVVGAPAEGSVYRYKWNGTEFEPDTPNELITYQDVGETLNARFGQVVKLCMSGRAMVVSAPNSNKLASLGGMIYSFR